VRVGPLIIKTFIALICGLVTIEVALADQGGGEVNSGSDRGYDPVKDPVKDSDQEFSSKDSSSRESIPNIDFTSVRAPAAEVADGCTQLKGLRRVRDTWSAISFRGACESYHRCYFTVGRTWSGCNRQFQKDLEVTCERGLAPAPGTGKEADPAALKRCYDMTNLFMRDVQQTTMISEFERAQKQQKEYLATLTQELQSELKKIHGRAVVEADYIDALEALGDGLSLEEYKRTVADSRDDLK